MHPLDWIPHGIRLGRVTGVVACAHSPLPLLPLPPPFPPLLPHSLARFFVGTSDDMYCSGALVTYRSILTAAHCFRNRYTQIPLERFKDDTVRIGGVGMYDGFLVNVERVVLHPSYDWITGDHDVAVMTIRNAPLPATIAAKGLIVARIGYRGRVRVGTRLTQSGWGRTNVNVTQVEGNGLKKMTLSPRLLRQSFAVNDLGDCKRKLLVEGGIVEKASASQFFCGSLNDTVASCRGDSGSPAFSKSVSRTGRTFFYVEIIVSVRWREGGRGGGGPGRFPLVRERREREYAPRGGAELG